ncbi:beta-defensin 130B [Notamacropus eugenii]|uniref:beta-defensin 130B n=1 Tax=Notamacropus eugenii TaxID=9315 RepID=UPI003B684923
MKILYFMFLVLICLAQVFPGKKCGVKLWKFVNEKSVEVLAQPNPSPSLNSQFACHRFSYHPEDSSALQGAMGGMQHGSRLCVQLQGVCRKDSCDTIEEKFGRCTAREVCCRKWWLSPFIPTPEPK